jgi:hypothetical protein
MEKRIVYIASPYSKGDPAINTHFQCKTFDRLLSDGKVIPVAPLWTHFQHLLFPRPYKDWVEYDLSLLHLYDACLRLSVTIEALEYLQSESSGADGEVSAFKRMGRPIFYSITDLYAWIEGVG